MASDVETKVRAVLESVGEGVAAGYLFGSQARGEAGQRADVDVAVLFEASPSPFSDVVTRIARSLERVLGSEVDLIVLNRAPADLVHRVLRDGILVCERDPSQRIAFEVRKRNEYFDLLPHLNRYRRMEGA